MTDRSKFEQMLEYLISEQDSKARDIFHELVVEKSREIYETILSEDLDEDDDDGIDEETEVDEDEDDVTESEEEEEDKKDKKDKDLEENFSFEGDDEEGDEPFGGEDDGEVGGDATDDFMGDIEDGGEEEGEGDMEDRVVDLEDALDDLRSEFEQMMAGDDEMGGDEMDMGMDGEEPEMDMGMDDEEEMKDSFDFGDNFMREYIEKVGAWEEAKPGGEGAGVAGNKHGTKISNTHTKSPVAGKNDMGGTTANMTKGNTAKGEGTKGGLADPSAKEENGGNINVPGGKAGKTAFTKKEPGHGAEKKGAGDNGDKGASSPINGVKSRAK